MTLRLPVGVPVVRLDDAGMSVQFWKHPEITVTQHTSARTLREESIAQLAGKIRVLERGGAVAGGVDHALGIEPAQYRYTLKQRVWSAANE